MGVVIARFDVHLVSLGHEIRKTRPCLVVSPDEMNRAIGTVVIAPMTTKGRPYPTRITCEFEGKTGQVVLDQLRTVDKRRLVKLLGRVDETTARQVSEALVAMFAW